MAGDTHDELGNAMMGSFIFYLLLHHAVNPVIVNETTESQCGWQGDFNFSGANYMPYFRVQRYPLTYKRSLQKDPDEYSEKGTR